MCIFIVLEHSVALTTLQQFRNSVPTKQKVLQVVRRCSATTYI